MQRLLIANRGEIAVRIIQACQDSGITAIAVFAENDRESLHVARANEAYLLEGDLLQQTYLNIEQIIRIAKAVGADAVHPGYGFLAENADFADAVENAGLVWVGPSGKIIRALGDKVTAKTIAIEAGAPVVPGTDGEVKNFAELANFAEAAGFPIAIKASLGGGGRGMRVVWHDTDLESAFESAQREALLAFGQEACFAEKYISKPRHIEVQFAADSHNNVVAVGTRDCSVQRRFQKLIEEAPAPFLSSEIRLRAIAAAKQIAKHVGYQGVGTVEFLLSESNDLYFLEVNTRLQVEHSVTEESTGVDLVTEQLRIAEGLPLSFAGDVEPRMHAIEFRITAEDPGRGFLPVPGQVTELVFPMGPGVRVDTGIRAGGRIQPEYDSLICKIIVSAASRAEVIARAKRALAETVIHGIPSVIPFHLRMLEEQDFAGANGLKVHTRWVEDELSGAFEADQTLRRSIASDHTLNRVIITVDGKAVELGLPAGFALNGQRPNESSRVNAADRVAGDQVAGDQVAGDQVAGDQVAGAIVADMDATVQKVLVAKGQSVQQGEALLITESMKMEIEVHAQHAGVVRAIKIQPGDRVNRGDVLVIID